MKSDKNGGHKPFEQLKALIDKRGIKLAAPIQETPPVRSFPLTETEKELDAALFLEAMSDVTPIARNSCSDRPARKTKTRRFKKDEEIEAVRRLIDLIQCGDGFQVCATPE